MDDLHLLLCGLKKRVRRLLQAAPTGVLGKKNARAKKEPNKK